MDIRNLLTVKSIVTLLMVGTFCILAVADFCFNHNINTAFLTSMGTIMGWYFGSQETKKNQENTNEAISKENISI